MVHTSFDFFQPRVSPMASHRCYYLLSLTLSFLILVQFFIAIVCSAYDTALKESKLEEKAFILPPGYYKVEHRLSGFYWFGSLVYFLTAYSVRYHTLNPGFMLSRGLRDALHEASGPQRQKGLAPVHLVTRILQERGFSQKTIAAVLATYHIDPSDLASRSGSDQLDGGIDMSQWLREKELEMFGPDGHEQNGEEELEAKLERVMQTHVRQALQPMQQALLERMDVQMQTLLLAVAQRKREQPRTSDEHDALSSDDNIKDLPRDGRRHLSKRRTKPQLHATTDKDDAAPGDGRKHLSKRRTKPQLHAASDPGAAYQVVVQLVDH